MWNIYLIEIQNECESFWRCYLQKYYTNIWRNNKFMTTIQRFECIDCDAIFIDYYIDVSIWKDNSTEECTLEILALKANVPKSTIPNQNSLNRSLFPLEILWKEKQMIKREEKNENFSVLSKHKMKRKNRLPRDSPSKPITFC